MYDSNSKDLSYTAGFFILIAFAVASILLASIISIPVWTTMTGKSVAEMEKAMSDPANSGAAKVLQCIQAIIGFFIPAVLTAYMLNRRPLRLLGYSPDIKWKQTGLVILIMFLALLVSASLSYFNERIPISAGWKLRFDKMEGDYNQQVEAILGLNNAGEYILSLIIMAFIPAVCEETLFRGGLQNFLTRATKMPWLSVLVVSFIFSASHVSFYGFLSRFFLGIILGLLYQYSGKIWVNIIAHFMNNAIAITAIYIYKLQGKPLKEAIGDSNGSYWGLMALPVVVGLLYLFKKKSADTEEERALATQKGNQETPLHGL